MTDVLSTMETARLVELEQVIGKGLETFVEVGEALAEIRDSRLYRSNGDTFEAYCREQWGLSNRYVNMVIGAAAVAASMGTIVPITNVGQARALAAVPVEDRDDVWGAAVAATNGKPTAKAVAEARKAKADAFEYETPDLTEEQKWKSKYEELLKLQRNSMSMLSADLRKFPGTKEQKISDLRAVIHHAELMIGRIEGW